MSNPQTLQEVLEERARSRCPGELLFYPLGNTHTPSRLTYKSLYDEARQASRLIQRIRHFEAGGPVLLHFDDHRDTVVWFWSTLLAGGLPVLSPPFSNVEDERDRHIRALSALLESPVCLTRAKFLPAFGDGYDIHVYPVESLAEELNKPSHGTEGPKTNDAADHVGPEAQSRTPPGLPDGDPPAVDSPRQNTDENDNEHGDTAMLMLTSGSTGPPKAVPLRHAQVIASVSGKAGVRRLPPGRPFFNWVGLDHVAGLLEVHLQALWLGAGQVHAAAGDMVPHPRLFLDLVSRHGACRTFAPNFFLARLVSAVVGSGGGGAAEEENWEGKWDLTGLACITSGGEANDTQTTLAASALLSRYGAPRDVIMPGFGMTEICAGAIYNTDCPGYDLTHGYAVASQGFCMNGIEMRITTTPDGKIAPANEPGDLEVRGPVVFKGYYRNPAATGEAFSPDDWFRTGDRGFIDPNGVMSLVGRSKEVININGVKFVATDVQAAVEGVLGDRVARVLVFPSRAEHTEQVTVAYIPRAFPEQGDDDGDERAEVARLVTQACLVSTTTRPVVFALREESVPRLPMSTLGKVSRLKMARLFEDGVFAADLEAHDRAMLRCTSKTADEARKGQPRATSDAEYHLLQDVAQTLSLASKDLNISHNTSLFDAGFTSMHVIKLKHHIERRLGTEVPILQIMKNPTIKALAAQLERPNTNPDQGGGPELEGYDPVVVLRAGGGSTSSKTPLWLIHPGSGEVLVFVGLAQHLAAAGDDDRPIYALRAPGFEHPSQRFESISQAVGTYTAAVRRAQPRGPYALAGYSYGAVLAFEVAKRLEDGYGEEVRFLASLDLPPHIKQRMRALTWNICLLHLARFLGLVTETLSDELEDSPEFCAAPRAGALRWVLGVADKTRWDELRLDAGAVARWADVAYGLQHIAGGYEPSGRVDSIDVFHCAPPPGRREAWLWDYLPRWADFVREPPRFHAVKGGHYTMLGGENVESFVRSLMRAMEARGV